MIQTVEAIIDSNGQVRLLSEVQVDGPRRALVMILDESAQAMSEITLLSEPALTTDWNRPEEDAAWSHLQSEQ